MPLQATAPASSTGGSSVHESVNPCPRSELDCPQEFSEAGLGRMHSASVQDGFSAVDTEFTALLKKRIGSIRLHAVSL